MKFEKLKKGENPANDKLNKESLIFAIVISILVLITLFILGVREKLSVFEALTISVIFIPLVFFASWIIQCAVTRTLAPEGTNHILRMLMLALTGGLCLLIAFFISRINMKREIQFIAECFLIGISIFSLYSALIMLVELVLDPIISYFKYRNWRHKE